MNKAYQIILALLVAIGLAAGGVWGAVSLVNSFSQQQSNTMTPSPGTCINHVQVGFSNYPNPGNYTVTIFSNGTARWCNP